MSMSCRCLTGKMFKLLKYKIIASGKFMCHSRKSARIEFSQQPNQSV